MKRSVVVSLLGVSLLSSILLNGPKALAQGPAAKAVSGSPSGSPPGSPSGSPSGSSDSDKVDVSDLERKYWASKDTDFSVVQNRVYSKANRLALTLQYGFLINDQWSDGRTTSGSLTYFLSERFGVEAHLQATDSVNNKSLSALQSQSGTPNHGKVRGYRGLSANWVPFYAKMSVLNSSIIYFDMAISPGIGSTSYDQQRSTGAIAKTAPTLSLDITQSFFFSKHFALRVDYKNRWFQEEVVSYNTGAAISNDTAQTSLLMFGLTYYY